MLYKLLLYIKLEMMKTIVTVVIKSMQKVRQSFELFCFDMFTGRAIKDFFKKYEDYY